jgi:hypothetical protein
MHIYNESTSRKIIWRVQINWSRERTFSERQVNYIKTNLSSERGVYCIYFKDWVLPYSSPDWATNRWSRVVYIGSGKLKDRFCAHLKYKKNTRLAELLKKHELAYRCDRIIDTDVLDWPKTVEAALLEKFEEQFGQLPPANSRHETIPDLPLNELILNQSSNFNFLARG